MFQHQFLHHLLILRSLESGTFQLTDLISVTIFAAFNNIDLLVSHLRQHSPFSAWKFLSVAVTYLDLFVQVSTFYKDLL